MIKDLIISGRIRIENKFSNYLKVVIGTSYFFTLFFLIALAYIYIFLRGQKFERYLKDIREEVFSSKCNVILF